MCGEAEIVAQTHELLHATFGLVAKAEVIALVYLDCAEAFAQDTVGELRCTEPRKLGSEGKRKHRIDTGLFEQRDALRQRRDELERKRRPEHTRRVRIKDHRHALCAAGFRMLPHAAEDILMPEMNTVEVTNADDCGSEAGRDLVESAINVHAFRARRECAVRHRRAAWIPATPDPPRREGSRATCG